MSRRLRAVVLALVAHVGAVNAAPLTPIVDDPTRAPYVLSFGPNDAAQRAGALEQLAWTAAAAGDQARAARFLAIACYARSTITLDATLSADSCAQARKAADALDLVDVHVYLDSARGNLLAWQLDVGGAVSTLTSAISRGAALDVESDLGAPVRYARFALAAIVLEAGRYDQAAGELEAIRAAGVAGRDPLFVAWCDLWMCRVHARLGDVASARARCAASRRHAEATQDWLLSVNLEWIDGDLESDAGHHDAALARFRRAWALAHGLGVAGLQAALMVEIPGELLALGRIDEAAAWQATVEAALPGMPATYAPQVAYVRGMIARARADAAAARDAFLLAANSPIHGVAIHARYELAATQRELGDLGGARATLEDALARVETDRAAVGPDQRASFMTMHATAYRELIGVHWELDGAAAAVRALELAEAGRARALLDAITMSASTTPSTAVLSADQIRASLAADVALIEYATTRERTLAIVATRDAVTLVPLPAAGGEIVLAPRISFFQQLVAEAQDEAALRGPARRLHADLLAPALAALPDGGARFTTLVISPDGPLHGLPWDALGDDTGFVVERWRVAVVPSASVVSPRPRPPASAAALVIAVPAATGGLPALPAALTERDVVRRRVGGDVHELVGPTATEEAIARELGRHAVVHVAGHATIDRVMPLRSALLVSAGDGGDGRLRAEELYRLTVGADLVVLAACETGIGAETSGEGVMSLARAFLHTGARATIATLWPVDDAIGPAFADALYRRLTAGQTILQATAEARRELRARGAGPSAWAAYVVSASPSDVARIVARPGAREPGRRAWWLVATGGAVAALALVMLARRRRALVAALIAVVAAGGGGLAALTWFDTPSRAARLAPSPRGATPGPSVTVIDGHATWVAEGGVDDRVTFVDGDGRILAATRTATPAIPSGATWIMVERLRDGALVAPPSIVALPR